MPRYAAFLRGVSPMNAKMPELKRCFEATGFTGVKTLLSSGNVLFDASRSTEATLQRKIEAGMKRELDRVFLTIVRSVESLRAILDANPFQVFQLPTGAKRVITFLRDAPGAKLKVPIELDGACIACIEGLEVFSYYVPSPKGAVFMGLIEKTFRQAVTTRTWDTVTKAAK